MALQNPPPTSKTPKLTIDGKPVALFGWRPTAHAAVEPRTSFDWELCFGVVSPVVTWELQPALADYVLSQREVAIHMEGFGAPPLDIRRVVVIGETGATNKRRRAIQLGDIRRYLKYSNPVAALNVRARTGNNSTNGFAGSGQFIQAIPTYAYRLYSVNPDGTPVLPAQVISRVMNLASQSQADWKLDSAPRATLIPNDIQLYDQGDVSVQRMLGTIGGMDLYVDPRDGLMHVCNRVMGDERTAIEGRRLGSKAGGPKDGEGWGKIVWRDESHNRPASFDIVVDPEMEFRSDFAEGSGGTQSAPDKDAPWSENVVEVMEYRPGNYLATTPTGKRQSLPGEYISITDYLATMPNGPLVPSLTLTLLQAGFNNTNLIYGILGDGQIPDPGEEARIKSALACYRQLMRINRRWVSRCRPGSIRAVMASVADAETGTRKPSDCYLDHCVIPTLETALGNSSTSPLPYAGWNRDSFPPLDSTTNNTEKAYTDSNGSSPSPLTSMRIAPFNARVIDSDAGIYALEPRPDFLDEREQLVPCRVLNLPCLDYTAANSSALNLYFWDQSPVAAQHRATVILSAIPGVGEYHTPVNMGQAAGRLGVATTPGTAPVMVVRIGQDLLTARFPWDDSKAKLIYQAFLGTVVNTPDDPLLTLVPANLSDIQDYAKGFCAALLANYLDHYEGNQVIPLDPTMLPVGSVHTVVHSIGGSGAYRTAINCMQVRDPFLADHFLSASTLATLRGRVTT